MTPAFRLTLLSLAVLHTVLVLVGCRGLQTDVAIDHRAINAAKAEMSFLVAAVTTNDIPVPVPDDTPDGSECTNCGGTGELGDGRVKMDCPECGGDGILATTDQPQAETTEQEPAVIHAEPKRQRTVGQSRDPFTGYMARGPTVVMITREGCPPCDHWWRTQRPSWEQQGWHVVPVTTNGSTPTPTFRVFDGTRWHGHEGFMTYSAGRDLLKWAR